MLPITYVIYVLNNVIAHTCVNIYLYISITTYSMYITKLRLTVHIVFVDIAEIHP